MAVRSSREREPQATSEGAFLKRSRRPVGLFAASLVAPIFFDQESLHPPKLLKQIAWNVVQFLRQWVECIQTARASNGISGYSRRAATLKKKRVSPHIVRHSTAMALLQSGVDIAVIALWLGHERA